MKTNKETAKVRASLSLCPISLRYNLTNKIITLYSVSIRNFSRNRG
jgi:hypothetical protein